MSPDCLVLVPRETQVSFCRPDWRLRLSSSLTGSGRSSWHVGCWGVEAQGSALSTYG